MMAPGGGSGSSFYASEMLNFLKTSPLMSFNLKPDQNGEVTFSENFDAFTNLSIIVVDKDSLV